MTQKTIDLLTTEQLLDELIECCRLYNDTDYDSDPVIKRIYDTIVNRTKL